VNNISAFIAPRGKVALLQCSEHSPKVQEHFKFVISQFTF